MSTQADFRCTGCDWKGRRSANARRCLYCRGRLVSLRASLPGYLQQLAATLLREYAALAEKANPGDAFIVWPEWLPAEAREFLCSEEFGHPPTDPQRAKGIVVACRLADWLQQKGERP